MSDRLIAAIRTAVAAGVVAAVAWAAGIGVELDAGVVTAAALGIVTGVYNWLVNLVAAKFPFIGYLMGIPTAPTYVPNHPPRS